MGELSETHHGSLETMGFAALNPVLRNAYAMNLMNGALSPQTMLSLLIFLAVGTLAFAAMVGPAQPRGGTPPRRARWHRRQ